MSEFTPAPVATAPVPTKDELAILEIVGFHFYRTDTLKSVEEPSHEAVWQSDKVLRKTYKEAAAHFLAAITDAGLKVDVSRKTKVEHFLNALAIVPAKKAYDFTQDI